MTKEDLEVFRIYSIDVSLIAINYMIDRVWETFTSPAEFNPTSGPCGRLRVFMKCARDMNDVWEVFITTHGRVSFPISSAGWNNVDKQCDEVEGEGSGSCWPHCDLFVSLSAPTDRTATDSKLFPVQHRVDWGEWAMRRLTPKKPNFWDLVETTESHFLN